MIHGLSHLLTLRKEGKRPMSTWVSVGIPYRKPVYSADFSILELVAEGSLTTDDFRPFVGLEVTLYSPEDCKTFTQLIEKMKAYATRMMVLCGEYGTDLGYEWHAKWGQHDLGELRWAEQFENARTSVCRTQEQNNERLRLESEALNHAPWILKVENGTNFTA